MPSPNECLNILTEAAGGDLTDDELIELVEELNRVRDARAATDSLNTMEDELFEAAAVLANEAEMVAMIEKRNRLINIRTAHNIRGVVNAAVDATGDPALGIHAILAGVNAPFKGARKSVDAMGLGIMRQTMGGMIADLQDAGLLRVFNSKAIERDVAKELWDLSLRVPRANATTNKQAKQIAKIVRKYQDNLVDMENRQGAFIRKREGYVTRQSHNLEKMQSRGAEAWAREIAPRLDWEAMGIPVSDRAKFLKSAWAAMVSGERKPFRGGDEADTMFAFKGPGNLAKRVSAHRTLLFKSADDWFDYNEVFGQSNLAEAISGDFRRGAQNTALMMNLGTNPEAMVEKMLSEQVLKHRDNPAIVKKLRSKSIKNELAEVDGSINIAQSYGAASIGRTVRAVQTMAKLGGAVISSVTDIAAAASERRYQGRSLMDSWGDAFLEPIKAFNQPADKKRMGRMMGVGVDGMMGDIVARFSAQDDVPGKTSKLMSMFFKLNLLGPWTDGVKRGMGMAHMADLADMADRSFDELDDATRRLFQSYDINAREWDIVKQTTNTAEDGTRYLMPADVDDVQGQVFVGLSQRQQLKVRDDIKTKFQTMLSDRVEYASPTPGARERAIMRQGLQPGTMGGEFMRYIMQFKGFPVTVTSKVLGRDIYGHGARSMSDAILKGQGDLQGLASYIAGGTVLGFVALQAKEVAKGREMRPASANLLVASMIQGGGLGIYGDFLLGETNRFGRSLVATAAGPTFGMISDIDKIKAKAVAGDDVWSEVLRVVQGNTPFANLFYLKTAMDYMIMYRLQEWANPGYLRRMERRMKRENNQKFIVPPSRVIPRGGF